MRQLDKKEAMKLLESLENDQIALNDLVRNACSIINSVANQTARETSDPYQALFQAIIEITEAINEIRRYNVRI